MTSTAPLPNLENGYWGIMALPVLETYLRNIQHVNRQNTIYVRSSFDADIAAIRDRLAVALGVAAEEIALTRGATEALQTLIAGYNRLKRGDVVLYADLDYDSMQYAMAMLETRRGVTVKSFAIPEPATRASVLDAYRKVLDETAAARLLLLTHLSHRTGLVLPVREIAAYGPQPGRRRHSRRSA
ncbi:aminotransferase class V-fold PLP-dependent enzyme [Bradyrhizobium sp. ma5]|uniref:aminotransferase class V-fold PLP-dependent enzyme n=1 Tax=Bradyrhizobium sp. ma5 TaxID=3344828 RepID=UPI0035D4CAEF